jgi:hypothetical protein
MTIVAKYNERQGTILAFLEANFTKVTGNHVARWPVVLVAPKQGKLRSSLSVANSQIEL